MNQQSLDAVARDVLTRGLAAVGLLGVALIHLLDAVPTFPQLPYKGWLYTGLIVGAVVVAGLLVRRPSRLAWAAAASLAGGAILAFVYSRTVGLPGAGDDVGNWSEPLGVASLFVEASVVAVSGYALAGLAPVRAVAARGMRGRLAVSPRRSSGPAEI